MTLRTILQFKEHVTFKNMQLDFNTYTYLLSLTCRTMKHQAGRLSTKRASLTLTLFWSWGSPAFRRQLHLETSQLSTPSFTLPRTRTSSTRWLSASWQLSVRLCKRCPCGCRFTTLMMCFRHGLCPSDLQSSSVWRSVVYEQHFWLPGRRRGVQPLWPLLYWPDHCRREGAPRKGPRHRWRCCRSGRNGTSKEHGRYR